MDVSAPFKEVTLGPAGKRMEVPTDRGISGNEMDIKFVIDEETAFVVEQIYSFRTA